MKFYGISELMCLAGDDDCDYCTDHHVHAHRTVNGIVRVSKDRARVGWFSEDEQWRYFKER